MIQHSAAFILQSTHNKQVVQNSAHRHSIQVHRENLVTGRTEQVQKPNMLFTYNTGITPGTCYFSSYYG